MKKYTYVYSGDITVEAEDEEEALDKVEDLMAPTAWQAEHCVDISLYELRLSEVDDE